MGANETEMSTRRKGVRKIELSRDMCRREQIAESTTCEIGKYWVKRKHGRTEGKYRCVAPHRNGDGITERETEDR